LLTAATAVTVTEGRDHHWFASKKRPASGLPTLYFVLPDGSTITLPTVGPEATFVGNANRICVTDDEAAEALAQQLDPGSGPGITTHEQYARLLEIGVRDTKQLEALSVPPQGRTDAEEAVQLQSQALRWAEKASAADTHRNPALRKEDEAAERRTQHKSAQHFDALGALLCGTERETHPTVIW
jgi:hypothetical protein